MRTSGEDGARSIQVRFDPARATPDRQETAESPQQC
jgi:hypothetical protein